MNIKSNMEKANTIFLVVREINLSALLIFFEIKQRNHVSETHYTSYSLKEKPKTYNILTEE